MILYKIELTNPASSIAEKKYYTDHKQFAANLKRMKKKYYSYNLKYAVRGYKANVNWQQIIPA
jgi:hypothetical protein